MDPKCASQISAVVESPHLLVRPSPGCHYWSIPLQWEQNEPRASEMSNLLEGRNEQTWARPLRRIPLWKREALSRCSPSLTNEGKQANVTVLPKKTHLRMTYGGRNNTEPWRVRGSSRQMSPKKKVCATLRRRMPGIPSPSCPVAKRMAWEIRRNESSPWHIYWYRIYVRQRERCLGVHVRGEDIGGVGGIGSPPKYPRPSYPIHLLLFKQSESTDYVSHGTKNVSLQSQR